MAGQHSFLRFEKDILAPAKEVFRAFTAPLGFSEWLCDTAIADAFPHGRLYLWWSNGYYSAGEYKKLELNKEVIFTWKGKDDPDKTEVNVRIKEKAKSTHLIIFHRGLKSSIRWNVPREQIRRGWETGLENLASILTTGQDLRIVNRPMLGIFPDEFDAGIAAKLGLPVSAGIRLANVAEGLGAQKAGLMKGDVIIGIAGREIAGYPDLVEALRGKKAGETVEVRFFRGRDPVTLTMELSRREIPKIPQTAAELADISEKNNIEGQQAIIKALSNTSEAEATQKPSPEDWSAKEILAHLIQGERDFQFNIHKTIMGEEFNYPSNLQARIDSMVDQYPSIQDMLNEFIKEQKLTVSFIRRLPEDFIQHKGAFWLFGYGQLNSQSHTLEHVVQIEASIAAARSK